MRKIALTAALMCAAMGGIASADTWTDPAGRVVVDLPAGWQTQQRGATGQTAIIAFNAANDCYIFGVDNPGTANVSANAVRNATTPLTPEAWVSVASGLRDFFGSAAPSVTSQSVDTSAFWPVQRVEYAGASRPVYGALQIRPGVELRGFCSGAGGVAVFDRIFASMRHPNDVTWQGAAERQAAERAAATTQQAPPAAEQPQETNRRRRNNNN
jgi:hypothetical protein